MCVYICRVMVCNNNDNNIKKRTTVDFILHTISNRGTVLKQLSTMCLNHPLMTYQFSFNLKECYNFGDNLTKVIFISV